MDDNSVRFKWRDYRDGNKVKVMSLDAMEFIRRFLMHILPSGFQKIRYYGLLSNRNRSTRLITCFKLLKTPILKSADSSWIAAQGQGPEHNHLSALRRSLDIASIHSSDIGIGMTEVQCNIVFGFASLGEGESMCKSCITWRYPASYVAFRAQFHSFAA